MGIIKSPVFWIGFASGLVVGPVILGKVAPGLKSKLPGQP